MSAKEEKEIDRITKQLNVEITCFNRYLKKYNKKKFKYEMQDLQPRIDNLIKLTNIEECSTLPTESINTYRDSIRREITTLSNDIYNINISDVAAEILCEGLYLLRTAESILYQEIQDRKPKYTSYFYDDDI